MFDFNFNWKTVAALGASVAGIILAIKIGKNEAKSAFEHFVDVIFAPNKVINAVED